MATKKIPVSLKISETLFSLIEEKRGSMGRGPFIEDTMRKYFFEESEGKSVQGEHEEILKKLEDEIDFLRERIVKSEILLIQLQAKIPPAAIEKPKRRGFLSIFKRWGKNT